MQTQTHADVLETAGPGHHLPLRRQRPWHRAANAVSALGICVLLSLAVAGCGKRDTKEPVAPADADNRAKTKLDPRSLQMLMERTNRQRTTLT